MNPIKLNEWMRIAESLRDMCGDDDDLFADMVEGETNAIELIGKLHQERAQALELIEGIKAREADLKARKARLQTREAAIKASIGQVLRAVKLPKAELPEVTYSVRDGKPSLTVADVAAVPDEYLTYKPAPNKVQINADFDPAGELPNWLSVEPAKDIVTGRTK